MLDTRAFRPFPGRIRRNAGAFPLPVFWIETGETFAGSFSEFVDHPIWALPNTYPFMPIDTRVRVVTGVGRTFEFTRTPMPPEVFADTVQDRIEQYQATYGPVFERIGKPMRYAFTLVGPDAPFDSPLWVTRHPQDVGFYGRPRPWMYPPERLEGRSRTRIRRNRTYQGLSPRPGADGLGTPGRASFFHHEARKATRAWATEAFAAARARLDSLGLPHPEILVTDLESASQQPKYAYSVYDHVEPLVTPAVTSWFERLVRDHPVVPQDHAYDLDGGSTFNDWLAARTTRLDGTPLPPHNPHFYAVHPAEHDLGMLVAAARDMSYARSLSYAIFEPAKAAFPGVKCGEWGLCGDGRALPSQVRPGLFRYWKAGSFGLDFQIPANYPLSFVFDETRPFADPDPRWHLPANWTSQVRPKPTAERDHQSNLEQQSSVDDGASRSTAAEIFPSTAVTGLLSSGELDVGLLPLIERVMRTVIHMGAEHIWVFAPSFNSPGSGIPTAPNDEDRLRDETGRLVQALVGMASNATAPRNRFQRRSRVATPMLSWSRT